MLTCFFYTIQKKPVSPVDGDGGNHAKCSARDAVPYVWLNLFMRDNSSETLPG